MCSKSHSVRNAYEEQIKSFLEKASKGDILELREPVPDTDRSEKTRSLDFALRNVLRQILESVEGESKDSESQLEMFVDVVVHLCEEETASPNLPATIFTDIFETLTISVCERLFHLMENRVQIWKKPVFQPCKNQLLRMCNDLLRRLSRNQNTVFCGQILIVLAKLFPLSERSGLNIVSEFNTENVSIMSSLEEQSTDSDSSKISNNLYRKFWSLQEFFRQPNLCYSPNNWRQMTKCSSEVLTAFSSFKLDDNSSTKASCQAYFAKYLTSKKLFQLELSDSNFRRYILIQFLIMFQYLKATVRFKLESQVLNETQSQWVREKTDEIYVLLRETPPNGEEFSILIGKLMAREDCWNSWKNDNCPAFKVPDAMGRKAFRKRKRVGDDIREHLERGQLAMGDPELTRLFNICPNHWDSCRVERRNYVPTMEAFFEEAIAQSDPAACIEDGYKLIGNPNWGWRALRILSQKSLHFFTSTNQPAKTLPSYLEAMVGSLAKDLCLTKDPKDPNGIVKVEDDDNSQDDFKEEDAETQTQIEPQKDTNSQSNDGVEEPPPKKSRTTPQEAPGKSTLTGEQIESLAKALGRECAILVPHLGLSDDELQYIQSQHDEPSDQAKHLLTLWKENEPQEATMEKIRLIASKLGLADKLETIA